jgi:hypothetical protein
VDRDRLLLLFPSLPAVRNTTTCNNRKRTTQSILVFISFVFEICFGFFSSSFRSAPLLCLLPSLFQAGRFVMGLSSTVVQLLMAGLCRGELVGGGRCAAVVRSAGFVVDGDGEIGGR